MKLKVEAFSQRNWLYSWRKLGNTGSSIYYYGCYFMSLYMFARFKGFIYSVPEFLSVLNKNGGFIKDQINPDGVLKVFGPTWKFERKDWENVSAHIDVIKELIDSGYPVVSKVDFVPSTSKIDEHFVLVTGYVVNNGKITDLWANDPWTGKEILICQTYPYLKLHTPERSILGARIYRLK